ncbi:MAG: amidohydrolase family protein [Planctomycetota bacterium]
MRSRAARRWRRRGSPSPRPRRSPPDSRRMPCIPLAVSCSRAAPRWRSSRAAWWHRTSPRPPTRWSCSSAARDRWSSSSRAWARRRFAAPVAGPCAGCATQACSRRSLWSCTGTYLNDTEIACLASAGASVVHCPRSHAFFGHVRHPVVELRAAGVRVVLGTDSLASNQSLSMLEEIAFLRRARPDLEDRVIFTMATRDGAVALGLPAGALRPGLLADVIAVVPGSGRSGRDVIAAIVAGGMRVVLSMVGGRLLLHDPEHASLRGPARSD